MAGAVLVWLPSCIEQRYLFTVTLEELDAAATQCPGGLSAVVAFQGGGGLPKMSVNLSNVPPAFGTSFRERALASSALEISVDCGSQNGASIGHAEYRYQPAALVGHVRVYAPGIDPAKIVPASGACSNSLTGSSGDAPCATAAQ